MTNTVKVSLTFTEYENAEELVPGDLELVQAAREAALNAYAPYSGFSVGAAVRLESGRIISGTNVENAAFPAGICAERNAMANAISNYPGDNVIAIGIAAFTKDGLTQEPVTPCGTCRQVIAEEEFRNGKEIRLVLSGKSKTWVVGSMNGLLPLQFNRDHLRPALP